MQRCVRVSCFICTVPLIFKIRPPLIWALPHAGDPRYANGMAYVSHGWVYVLVVYAVILQFAYRIGRRSRNGSDR